MTEDRDLQQQLEALDIGTRVLYAEIIIGKDAEEFLVSELGKMMVGLAQQDYADAVMSLAEMPWWRVGKMQELQLKAQRAKTFVDYLKELIVRGRQGQAALRESEEDNG